MTEHIHKSELEGFPFKIDDLLHHSHEQHITGESMLAKVDKSSIDFGLFQAKMESGVESEQFIKPADVVKLEKERIEFFTTKKLYPFYIEKREYRTFHGSLTVKDILERYAEVDPSEKELAESNGSGGFIEYKDLDKHINLVSEVHHFTLFDKQPVGKS